MRPEVSVVIRARNEWPQVCATILSFHEDLAHSGISHEVVLVSNLSTDSTPDVFLHKFSRWTRTGLLKIVRYDEKPSTWCAANAGLDAASGEIMAVADAHLSIKLGTMRHLIETARELGGLVHAPVQLWGDDEHQRSYGYDLRLAERFWGDPCRFIPAGCRTDRPWLIPMAGACLFAFQREEADRMSSLAGTKGLYAAAFRAYGGGEPYLAMKWWRLGSRVWIEPRALVRHAFGLRHRWEPVKVNRQSQRQVFVKGRGITRDLKAGDCYLAYDSGYGTVPNADFYYNFMLAARIAGGSMWLEDAQRSFSRYFRDQAELARIVSEVDRDGAEEARRIDGAAEKSLDDLVLDPPWKACGRHEILLPERLCHRVEAAPA